MGDLIHSLGQSTLLLEVPVLVCRRCKGGKTVYHARNRSNIDVIGGKRMPCPERAGTGVVGGVRPQKARYLGFPQPCCSAKF